MATYSVLSFIHLLPSNSHLNFIVGLLYVLQSQKKMTFKSLAIETCSNLILYRGLSSLLQNIEHGSSHATKPLVISNQFQFQFQTPKTTFIDNNKFTT